jgi:hypothetical protein
MELITYFCINYSQRSYVVWCRERRRGIINEKMGAVSVIPGLRYYL